jgi:hypothetical protein
VFFPEPEGPVCSLNHLGSLVPISTFVFNFPEAIIFDSISIVSSFILAKVVALLSLKSKAKSKSKAPAKVTFAVGCEGFTSAGILLLSLLNI